MHGPTPWRWQEMTATIVVRDANGHTVCNLPLQGDKAKRRANAEIICRTVNALYADATPASVGLSELPT